MAPTISWEATETCPTADAWVSSSCNTICHHGCYSDPFADDEGGTSQDGYIHIRIQQRNGRKTLTTVQGISSEFDLKKIVKVAKKVIGMLRS